MNKAVINTVCRYFCRHSFQFIQVNTNEHNCWIIRYEYVQFWEKTTKLSFKMAVPFLHSHQQKMRVLIAPHLWQHAELSVFRILATLIHGQYISHCYFNLHFPDDVWLGTTHLCFIYFSYTYLPPVYLLWTPHSSSHHFQPF